MNENTGTSSAYYPVMVISNTHLGIRNSAADTLDDFLSNTKCDTLILNGDIIDGLCLEDSPRLERFFEVQARFIDIINRKIAEGTQVFYLPGNHDIKLRSKHVLGKTLMGIHFEETLDFIDLKHRHLLIAHGDQFSNGLVPDDAKNLKNFLLKRCYTAATNMSSTLDAIAFHLFRGHVGLVGKIKAALVTYMGRKGNYAQAGMDYAREHGYDGIICGHFHTPDTVTAKDGVAYMNSGDWVENFTALAEDSQGNWKTLKWPALRNELMLKDAFNAVASKNPDQRFRPKTERMIKAIQKMWPRHTSF